MKKTQLETLRLNKKSISSLTANELKGKGITTTLSTISDISRSCPHNCGSKQ